MALMSESYDDRIFWSEFIILYRNLPVLWTKIHFGDADGTHNKHLRDRALNILLRKYRDLHPTATLNTVKKVLKSLHCSYREELRLGLEHEREAGNVSSVYESPLWCFKLLDFIRPREECRLQMELLKQEGDDSIINTTNENDAAAYYESLATTIRKLSVEQQKYAKHHIDTILQLAMQGLLTSGWPQFETEKLDKCCNCSTTNRVEQRGHQVSTVKGAVRFDRRSTIYSVAQRPTKRGKRATIGKTFNAPMKCTIDCEQPSTIYKNESSMTDIMIVGEEITMNDNDESKLEQTPQVDEKLWLVHHQPEDFDTTMESIEVSLPHVKDPRADAEHRSLNLMASTVDLSSNDKNVISVRMPSGPTVRRQCTMHTSNFVEQVVANYNDDEFLRQFRMGRDIVQILCQNLEKTCAYKKLKGHGGYEAISPQTHVLAFLWFLGQEKASYRDVADRFELSLSCLHDVIWRVCDSIFAMEADVIVAPDDEKKSSSANHFAKSCSIPGVIGCVVGTHIKIDKPIENSDRFLLRRGYYSMQLQAVIDENLHFVDVFVEYPGEPDMLSRVKSICADQYCLLGGEEYPCLPQILVPYRIERGIPLTRSQTSFNEQLHKARNSCVNVFQILKQRFRQLHHLKGRQLSRIVKLIKVCCILHNLASESVATFCESEAVADRAEELYLPAALFTYRSEHQAKMEVARGQQRRDAISVDF